VGRRAHHVAGGGPPRGRILWTHLGERSGAVLEAPALVAGFDNVAVVGKAIEQRGRNGQLVFGSAAGCFCDASIAKRETEKFRTGRDFMFPLRANSYGGLGLG